MTSTKCNDAIKAWDEPPPLRPETTSPGVVRQPPMILSSSIDSSQTSLTDKTSLQWSTCEITSTASICPHPHFRNWPRTG